MRVVVLLEPNYAVGEPGGPPGTAKRDHANPDEALRDRPIIGLELLSEYRYEGGKWQGRIYDPESGKVYDSTMRVGRDDKLRMRGYIGMPMFGRTETFQPLRACTASIRTMLAASTLQLEAGCD